MKTQIFKDHNAFLGREDKTLNGVSEDFAKANPDFEKHSESNEACWNCSRCSGCSGCSRCSRCSGCSGCSDCYGCYGKKGENSMPAIPVIPNIHRTIFEAASQPDALDMSDWHSCDTTHCRAGWVVHKAGKAGYELEKRTSTLFAAMQIYHKSSSIEVSPVRYFEPNERAMADMKRCAEEEAQQQPEGSK